MKTKEEILNTDRLTIKAIGDDGGAAIAAYHGQKKPMLIVFSWGGGWDHVSVSYPHRCPTWDEMCFIKNLFFHEDEACLQYHPSKDEYVNRHPYCLHIWKPQGEPVATPPKWMVG